MSNKIGRARVAALAATGLAATTIVIATATTADAATLGNPSFSATTSAASATNVAYTWAFTAPTGGTLTSMVFGTTGTTGTATLDAVYGLDCTLDVAVASDAVTITPHSATTCTIPAGQSVGVTVGGLTNGGSGAPTSSAITVTTGSGTDSATATLVDTVSASTAVSVLVPESLTLSTNATAISLTAIPGIVGQASKDVTLTVATNASSYALHACIVGTVAHALSYTSVGAGTTSYIPSSATGAAAPLSGSNVGLGASVSSSGASLASPWTGTSATDKLGYTADCTNSGSVVANGTPTTGDTVTFSNAVYAEADQAAGKYTGTIQYSAVPTF